jgi:hypothetical protein
MKKSVFLVFLAALFSCSNRNTNIHSTFLTQGQMIEALVQVHLLESAVQLNLLDGIREDSLSLGNYYSGLFLDKEYSLQDFEDSFTFYAKEPHKMESLLDSVLTRIQMME